MYMFLQYKIHINDIPCGEIMPLGHLYVHAVLMK